MSRRVDVDVRTPAWWRRLWSANPYLVDGVIAALLLVADFGSLLSEQRSGEREADAMGVVLLAAGAGALTWRRAAPMPVVQVVLVAYYAYFLLDYPNALNGVLAVAVWTAVTRAPRPPMPLIANAALPLVGVTWLLDGSGSRTAEAVSAVIAVVFTALLGYNIRLRRENRVQEVRTEQAETDRAVSDERLRIARELHDVVAHAMSVVAVQAGVAAHVIDDQPAEAKRMLENVRITSHEALDEMRRLLGVLRGDATLAPAPGLAEVDALVESMRESGVTVDVAVVGTTNDVPGGVDLTAYRIVQEALTNVLKHAGTAHVELSIRHEPGLVTVQVDDDGRGGDVHADGGHGLLGMRERVAVFGGELAAGPKPAGGFRVRATLPYGT